MGIEKMELVNIAGPLDDLDNALVRCRDSGCFHIEPAIHSSDKIRGLRTLNEENPYQDVLSGIKALASSLSVTFENTDEGDVDIASTDSIKGYVNDITERFKKLNDVKQDNLTRLNTLSDTKKQLEHLSGLSADFERIFACEYVKVRVGKMPVDSSTKLSYYDDKNFIFVPFDKNETYVWGMYFAPLDSITMVDYIFSSLYFERINVPDFVKGTPAEAFDDIQKETEELTAKNKEIDKELKQIVDENKNRLSKIYSSLNSLNNIFELRKMVAVIGDGFCIEGFIPSKDKDKFEQGFESLERVSVVINPPETDAGLVPPTKLKNGFFSRPFAMLVEMYGLPAYGGINPTAFFAIIYSLLFGIMFGDVGQGLLLVIGGLVMTHVMKKEAGGILTRIGIFSTFFGFVYGSVFGYEELLDPLYKKLGIEKLHIHVFSQTNLILISAIAIGVIIIAISILLNIVIGFRQKDYERAIFGNNGIAGFVFYISLILGLAVQLTQGIKVMTTPYIIFLIVIPLLLMFFRVPLSNLVKYRKAKADGQESDGIGTFIAENFFELFEFLLSFTTNTLSFLRVGGFVMSHAGMMLVVMTLSDMVSRGASIFVVVLGNAFVMALEGMIVAIQVMRLGYYEVFSRFYDGNGKPFVPVGTQINE